MALQSGKGRKLGSIAVAAICFFLLEFFWDEILSLNSNPLDALQKIAFVSAAFSVTAYNLRTRVIDLVLKLEGSQSRIMTITRISRECGKRLTNLVVFFTGTAALMAAAGFFPVSHLSSKWYACAVLGLFGATVVNFLYVLFAFERLERFMLDDSEEKAKEREAKRLLGEK